MIGHVERVYGATSSTMLAECHVLVIAAPLTPETEGPDGRGQFAQLSPAPS